MNIVIILLLLLLYKKAIFFNQLLCKKENPLNIPKWGHNPSINNVDKVLKIQKDQSSTHMQGKDISRYHCMYNQMYPL